MVGYPIGIDNQFMVVYPDWINSKKILSRKKIEMELTAKNGHSLCLCKCAEIVGHGAPHGPFDSTAKYCNHQATHATVCDSSVGVDHCYNIGHYYCTEHAPREAVKLPADFYPS